MQTQNRAAPHFLLGVLTMLSVGAILLSLAKAPPNDQTQLRTAAANTAAASSFRLAYTETIRALTAPATSRPSQSQAVVLYQAPDRVEDTVVGAQTITGLVIGPKHYRRVDNGSWQYLGTNISASGAQVAADIVRPLELVAEATGVTRSRSQVYAFTPADPRLLLDTVFGTQLSTLAPTAETYEATVSGEYLSVLQVSLVASGQQVTVDLAFRSLNHVPALEPPATG